ncbi:MAG: glycerophosphodiester phosphodiesterase, partial [Desulfurobacteriaceae bacterium]
RTKAGNSIILHDTDFSRVAGVETSPSEMTLGEIKEEIRIGEEEVPTLQEVISLVQGKRGLFIEIKEPETTDKVVETIEKTAGKTDWIAIISFYEEAIKRVGEISNISKGLIYSRPPGKIAEARELNCRIVLPRWQLATEKAVKFAHKLKLTVVAWTINDSQTLEKV